MRILRLLLIVCLPVMTLFAQKPWSLEDCIRKALKNNSDVRIAQQQAKIARAAIPASYSGILPSIRMYATGSREYQSRSKIFFYGELIKTPTSVEDYYSSGISVNQNIFDGGRSRNQIKQGYLSAEFSETSLRYYQQLIVTEVVKRYFEVLKAQQLLLAAEKALESSRSRVTKTEQMYQLGSIARNDLYKAQVQVGNDSLNVLQQKTNLRLALANLNLVMGRWADEPLTIQEKNNLEFPRMEFKDIFHTARTNNLDLQAYRKRVELEQLKYKISKGQYFPQLSLGYSYHRMNPELEKLYSELNYNWRSTLSLNLNFNLFDGFQRKSAIEQSLLNYHKALEELRQKELALSKEIQSYLLAYNTYQEMMRINELNYQAAREDLTLAEERYRQGSGTFLEILDAQSRLTSAEQALISARYDARIAIAQLEFLMGTVKIPE